MAYTHTVDQINSVLLQTEPNCEKIVREKMAACKEVWRALCHKQLATSLANKISTVSSVVCRPFAAAFCVLRIASPTPHNRQGLLEHISRCAPGIHIPSTTKHILSLPPASTCVLPWRGRLYKSSSERSSHFTLCVLRLFPIPKVSPK